MTLAPLVILLVLLAIDWRQTITICRTPSKREVWIEKIIGTYPKEHRVHLWFGACAGAAVAFALFPLQRLPWLGWLPDGAQTVVLLLAAVGETAAVVRNYRLGIKPAGLE
mgnify:CR=1 FL=1